MEIWLFLDFPFLGGGLNAEIYLLKNIEEICQYGWFEVPSKQKTIMYYFFVASLSQ